MKAIPWERFTTELLGLYVKPLRAPKTLWDMKNALGLYRELAGARTTADLTAPGIGRYVAGRPAELAPRTLAKELRYLRVAANYAVTNDYLRVSPFASRPLRSWVRVGPPKPRAWYSHDQVRKVLDLMQADVAELAGWPQWRARRTLGLFTIVSFCGLRRDEAIYLQLEDLDLANRCIAIRPGRRRLKTSASEAIVPIPLAAVPIVADWLEHRLDAPPDFPIDALCPWVFPNLNRKGCWYGGSPGTKAIDRLQQAAERAGVPGMTWQSLRASWATRAEGHGLSGLVIQRVLRHTTERTAADWYRARDLEALKEATKDFGY